MSPNAFTSTEVFCDDVGNDVTIPTPGSVSSSGLLTEVGATSVINHATSVIAAAHDSKISIPILGKPVPIVSSAAQVIKEVGPFTF